MARSSEGTELQANAYVEAERLLLEHVEALPRAAERALREFQPIAMSKPFQEAAQAWSQGDLAEELRSRMIDPGGSAAAVDDFDAVVTTREGADVLLGGPLLEGVVDALQEFARAVQSETPLAGGRR